ncbi:MAG: aminopeptidase P family protein [Verrucomicrobiota bacterium]
MRYDPIDPQLFVENRAKLAAKLKPGSFAVIHSNDIMPQSADGSMRFYQSSDLFWLTGVDQEETTLILNPHASNPADREMLFVRETSDLIRIWEGNKLTAEEATTVSGIENVRWSDRFESEFRRCMKDWKTLYLNANEHPRNASEVETREERFRKQCQIRYPQHRYERLAPLTYPLRAVKSESEIQLLRTACDITEKGFRRVCHFLKPGVKEYEIEAEFIHEFMQHRSRGFAYNPIIATGGNACVLHYLDNNDTCRDGDLLLLDVAAEYAHYNADLTRTIPVNGKFTDRQRAVYNAVLNVFKACREELLKPGVEIKAYQKEVGKCMEAELLSLDLLDPAKVAEERAKDSTEAEVKEENRLYRKYFMHGTSHSLGLDVHDVTPANRIVLEGAVYTIEPGIYLPEEGFGIRLENDVVVKSGANVDLLENVPIEAEDIEALIAGE